MCFSRYAATLWRPFTDRHGHAAFGREIAPPVGFRFFFAEARHTRAHDNVDCSGRREDVWDLLHCGFVRDPFPICSFLYRGLGLVVFSIGRFFSLTF